MEYRDSQGQYTAERRAKPQIPYRSRDVPIFAAEGPDCRLFNSQSLFNFLGLVQPSMLMY